MLNKIFAIIVTYNPEIKKIVQQYQSLEDQVDGFIYVDNNSEDNLINNYPQSEKVKLILCESNLGLGKAQNIGIREAIENGATHVVLFDQDSIADSKLIENLVFAEKSNIENGIKVGLVGPAIYNNFVFPPKLEKAVVKLGILIKKAFPNNASMEVEYCIASGSLISKDLFVNVGFINEDLFIDALDLEWCQRAKFKGYKILLCSDAKIFHELGNGVDDKILSHSPLREFYICRNNMSLVRMKHIPIGYRIRKFFLTPIRPLTSLVRLNLQHCIHGLKGIIEGIKYSN